MQYVQCVFSWTPERHMIMLCYTQSCQHGFLELHIALVWTNQPHILSLHLTVSIRHDTCLKLSCHCNSNKTHSRPKIIVHTGKQQKRFMRLFVKPDYTASPLSRAKYCSWHGFRWVLFPRLCLWWGAQTSSTSNNPPFVWKLRNNVKWRLLKLNEFRENIFNFMF